MKKKIVFLIILISLVLIRSIVLYDFAVDYLQNDEGLVDNIQHKYSGFNEFLDQNDTTIYNLVIRSFFSGNIVVHLNRFIVEQVDV